MRRKILKFAFFHIQLSYNISDITYFEVGQPTESDKYLWEADNSAITAKVKPKELK